MEAAQKIKRKFLFDWKQASCILWRDAVERDNLEGGRGRIDFVSEKLENFVILWAAWWLAFFLQEQSRLLNKLSDF